MSTPSDEQDYTCQTCGTGIDVSGMHEPMRSALLAAFKKQHAKPGKYCTPRPPESHEDFFRRTGHCGQCGGPGVYCTCTPGKPCGCQGLHEMGSARLPDALDVFMPEVASVDQETMW
jgi:hypothetical protein